VTGSYSRRAQTALIISSDPLGAALIGAAVELAGFRVSYSHDGESSPDAIRRVKPAVVLADASHALTASPASLGPALMTGAALVFYGPATRLRDLGVLAGSTQASLIVLPDDIDRLPALLTALLQRAPGRTRSE
jgi:hypothetical protein